jgi:hypothetical protein
MLFEQENGRNPIQRWLARMFFNRTLETMNFDLNNTQETFSLVCM